MRPVNLLPERHRPRGPTGGAKGSGYFLLGALALVLVGAVVYVVTLNSINSSRDKIAKANAQAARDTALANQLAPYGDFEKIKAQRVAAVTQLAQSRMDWERTVREISRLLPQGVWLTNVTASQAGKSSQGGPPATSASTAQGGAAAPQMTIDGCAASQAEVAQTLVRLREVQGASDVQLTHSSKPVAGSGAPASAGSNAGGCGSTKQQPNYSFEAIVNLTSSSATATAPKWLGGGS